MSATHRKAPSPNSGKHPLAFSNSTTVATAASGLQLLKETFAKDASGLGRIITSEVQSTALIVPRKGRKLPLHVLATKTSQPWEMLPMKAAAASKYTNFFGNACQFFGNMKGAILGRNASFIINSNRIGFELARVLQNLGILAGAHMVQDVRKCSGTDYVWQPGPLPQEWHETALYKNLKIRVDLRWDAYKPVWSSPTAPAAQSPQHTMDPVPWAVDALSRPSQPVLMTPQQASEALRQRPSGLLIMWHPHLGVTTDCVTEHYGLTAFALAHLTLPAAQVAQVRGALRAKALQEAGKPPADTLPLQKWSLVDWVRDSLQARAQQLAPSTPEVARERNAVLVEARRLQQQDLQKATLSLVESEKLQRELIAMSLIKKLGLSGAAGSSEGSSSSGSSRQQSVESREPSSPRHGQRR